MLRRFFISILFVALVAGVAMYLVKRLGQSSEPLTPTLTGEPLPVLHGGISILTWNLQWFPGNTQKSNLDEEKRHTFSVVSQLGKADADILCLQEVKGEKAINRLLEKMPEYKMQVVSDFHGAQEVAIISKMNALTAYAEEFAKADFTPPRGFVHAAYEIDGHRLLVYSVHLKSNVGGVEANIPKREEAAKQLLVHVEEAMALHLRDGAQSVSVVLSGDFNTSLIAQPFASEQTGRLIMDAGFDWGFRGVPEADSITWLSDGRYPDVTFDHIFARTGKGVGFGRSLVVPTDRGVSDHRPVVSFIQFPSE